MSFLQIALIQMGMILFIVMVKYSTLFLENLVK
jgi:hypothetical protein